MVLTNQIAFKNKHWQSILKCVDSLDAKSGLMIV